MVEHRLPKARAAGSNPVSRLSLSPLWILFNLYFYCLLGRGLEQQWGVFRFNLYYLCGMVGAILTCLITGYGTNYYLNLLFAVS